MIKFDMRALTDALVKVEAAADQLPQIAQRAQAEALGHAIIALNRGVYETPESPGYRRTFDLLRGIRSSGRATKNTATVQVWNEVEYAPYVDRGVGPHAMSDAQILAQASARPEAAPYFGRSGQKYSLPNPTVLPAAVFSLYRMQQLFAEAVKRALR